MNDAHERSSEVAHWLDDARLRLARANVAPPVMDEVLERARVLVAETGESPDDLFGPPSEWADEQVAERRSDGLPLAVPDPAASWRDVPVMGMYSAATIAAVVLVVSAIKGEWQLDYDLGFIGFPVLMGLVTVTALTVWEKTLSRRSLVVAAAAGGAVLTGGVALLGLLIWWGHGHVVATSGTWRLGLLVLAWALLGRLFDSVLPQKPPRAWGTPRTDDEWLGVLAGVLRLRADMPETRVRTIVAEARAHATEAGSSLQEEFGRPEDYASQFPADEVNRTRRKAWGYTALAGLGVILAVPPNSRWSGVVLAVGWGACAVWEWRRSRRS